MQPTGCVAPPGSGATTNPFACADLNLPYFGSGDGGWHIDLGWFADHPILTGLVLVILLTTAKSLSQAVFAERERS